MENNRQRRGYDVTYLKLDRRYTMGRSYNGSFKHRIRINPVYNRERSVFVKTVTSLTSPLKVMRFYGPKSLHNHGFTTTDFPDIVLVDSYGNDFTTLDIYVRTEETLTYMMLMGLLPGPEKRKEKEEMRG